MPGGVWYRLIIGLLGTIVVWVNQTYGTHLQATDVTSVVIGVIALTLIVIEGHVEASKNGAAFDPASFITALLNAIKEFTVVKGGTTTGGGTASGTGGGTGAPNTGTGGSTSASASTTVAPPATGPGS